MVNKAVKQKSPDNSGLFCLKLLDSFSHNQRKVNTVLCAQRLTASEVWISNGQAQHNALEDGVLNALRHQRFGSGLLPTPREARLSCAQRLTASEVWISADGECLFWSPHLCSTPYGIRGLDQDRKNTYSGISFRRCSTPYGIRGLDQLAVCGEVVA